MPENPKPGADGISARMTDDPKTNNKFTDVKKFGGEVTIYHDPHHPARSVVRRGISLQVLWVPFAAIVALA